MAHAEAKIAINQPVQLVFEFILDGMNNPLWRPSVIDIKPLTDKPYGLGSAFKQGLKGPGGRIDGDYEITEFQTNKFIKFQVTVGPARPTGTYQFESDGQSTTTTFVLDFQPRGLARLMNPIIQSSMQAEVGTLKNLKQYLESHA